MCIIYKPGSDLYITGWLSWKNHTDNRDHEIAGMNITISAINSSIKMPVCTFRGHTGGNPRRHPSAKAVIIDNTGLARQRKGKFEDNMRHYWPIRNEFAVIDGIDMKGKRLIIPYLLQK